MVCKGAPPHGWCAGVHRPKGGVQGCTAPRVVCRGAIAPRVVCRGSRPTCGVQAHPPPTCVADHQMNGPARGAVRIAVHAGACHRRAGALVGVVVSVPGHVHLQVQGTHPRATRSPPPASPAKLRAAACRPASPLLRGCCRPGAPPSLCTSQTAARRCASGSPPRAGRRPAARAQAGGQGVGGGVVNAPAVPRQ